MPSGREVKNASSRYRCVIKRVALLLGMQPQHRDFTAPLGAKRRWHNAKVAGAIVHGKLVGIGTLFG
jgi:hypothetical protein